MMNPVKLRLPKEIPGPSTNQALSVQNEVSVKHLVGDNGQWETISKDAVDDFRVTGVYDVLGLQLGLINEIMLGREGARLLLKNGMVVHEMKIDGCDPVFVNLCSVQACRSSPVKHAIACEAHYDMTKKRLERYLQPDSLNKLRDRLEGKHYKLNPVHVASQDYEERLSGKSGVGMPACPLMTETKNEKYDKPVSILSSKENVDNCEGGMQITGTNEIGHTEKINLNTKEFKSTEIVDLTMEEEELDGDKSCKNLSLSESIQMEGPHEMVKLPRIKLVLPTKQLRKRGVSKV